MNVVDLNEHDRDRGALAASIDLMDNFIEAAKQCYRTDPEPIERTLDRSSSQLLDEAMDDINDGGDGNPAQFSTDV